jgi:hypothetical protein
MKGSRANRWIFRPHLAETATAQNGQGALPLPEARRPYHVGVATFPGTGRPMPM